MLHFLSILDPLNLTSNVLCDYTHEYLTRQPASFTSFENARDYVYGVSTDITYIIDVHGQGDLFLAVRNIRYCIYNVSDLIYNDTHVSGTYYRVNDNPYPNPNFVLDDVNPPVRTVSVASTSSQSSIEDCVEEFKLETANVMQFFPESNECRLYQNHNPRVTLVKGSISDNYIYTLDTSTVVIADNDYLLMPRSALYEGKTWGTICEQFATMFRNVESASECIERAQFVKGSAVRYNHISKFCDVCRGSMHLADTSTSFFTTFF
eukprot:Awhi_evm2s15128